ncbi:MAG: DinB family protein [Ignavibacteria bacterium]|nr:DinB family protein [Ignavibacteria bacterium]
MKLSEISPKPEYYERYMNKCDDTELMQAIQTSIDELKKVPVKKWEQTGNKTYEPGKWTVKEIIQHLIDTERVFMFRALAFARGINQPALPFPQDDYAAASNANNRTVEDLIDELKIVRESLFALYGSFTPEMLNKTGSLPHLSAAAIGFVLPGHQRWHFRVIEEKYCGL